MIKELLGKINLGSFLTGNRKNLIILSCGTVISQLIPFAASPVLTRIYTPDQFSLLELVLRISALISVLATLRLDLSLPIPAEEKKAIQLFWTSLTSTFITSTLFLLFIVLFKDQISIYLDQPKLKVWLIYIPLLVLLTGISQNGLSFLLRRAKYLVIAIAKVLDSLINNLGKIVFGYFIGASLTSFILPNFIGVTCLALLPLFFIKDIFSKLNIRESFVGIKSILKEFSDFPKINLPNALIDTLHLSLIAILISHYFGANALGLYALKIRVLKTPTIVLGNTAGQIFFRTASKMVGNEKPVYDLFRKYLFYFSAFSFLIFTPFIIAGPELFSFIFGSEWTMAGKLAQITAPWMMFNFIASALSYLPVILKKQSKVLKFSLINLVLIISCWIFGYYILENFIHTVIIVSIAESLFFLIVILWYNEIAKWSAT